LGKFWVSGKFSRHQGIKGTMHHEVIVIFAYSSMIVLPWLRLKNQYSLRAV
jgi:hypothetical protein